MGQFNHRAKIVCAADSLMLTPTHPHGGKRILVVGSNSSPDSFELHVTDSLRHMGCEVVLHHAAGPLGATGTLAKGFKKISDLFLREPERLSEARLLRTTQEFSPGMILVLLGNQLSPKTVAAVRKVTPAPVVCWCQDQMTTLGRQYLLGSRYDAVFLKDRYMLDLFSRMIVSTTFHYLPEACNPRVHRPLALTGEDRDQYGCDVMLAGTLYYYRQEILERLSGFRLKVWGTQPDWLVHRLSGSSTGRYVHSDDKVRATLAAAICVNTLHYAEVNALNCRAFEIAGCGGFQLMTHVPVVAEHFEPGSEVVTFSSAAELVEKVAYYLQNPDKAAAIASRGQIRAHRDHTYEHRLHELLRVVLGQ
jgi:spore maturation protein CgeB